jgi:hypothetical protein
LPPRRIIVVRAPQRRETMCGLEFNDGDLMKAFLAIVLLGSLVVTPAFAQQTPHARRDFFAPSAQTLIRVAPFAPNPADIFYDNPTDSNQGVTGFFDCQ